MRIIATSTQLVLTHLAPLCAFVRVTTLGMVQHVLAINRNQLFHTFRLMSMRQQLRRPLQLHIQQPLQRCRQWNSPMEILVQTSTNHMPPQILETTTAKIIITKTTEITAKQAQEDTILQSQLQRQLQQLPPSQRFH